MIDTYDIHDYDEDFLERFIHQILPVYDLWSIRALRNDQKIIIDGSAKDTQKISDFLQDESSKQYPMDLLIILGTAEKGNPKLMLTRKRAYFKIRFDKNHNNEIGSPGFLDSSQRYSYNDQLQMFRTGISGIGNQFGNNQMSSMKGIIDMQVGEAVRAVRTEYDEIVLRKESEAIKRHAELESKFEAYKLAVLEQALNARHQELDEREQRLSMMHEEIEAKRLEGLGTVKDYTKVIAGGLFEVGKAWLGLDFGKNDDDEEVKSSKTKAQNSKEKEEKNEDLSNTQDESKKKSSGFEEFNRYDEPEIKHHQLKGVLDIEMILAGIKSLSVDEKMLLLDALMPEEEEENTENENKFEGFQELQENNDLIIDESETENNISENNQSDDKTENHDVQTNNDCVKIRNSNAKSNNKSNKTKKTSIVKTSKNNVKTDNSNGKSENINAQSEYNITHHMLANIESQETKNNGESLESIDSVENTS